MKKTTLESIAFVLSYIIVIAGVTAFMTLGFTEFSWEKLGYAYILSMALGIVPAGFIMYFLCEFIIEPMEERKRRKKEENDAQEV